MFVVEGIKSVKELLRSPFRAYKIYTTEASLVDLEPDLVESISGAELRQMSGLKSPNSILGVFYIPEPVPINFTDWIIVLDTIRDPGNLGTIIRLCDWFGVHHLVCSSNTVDCFNPKVLQATMGSIANVHIVYTDLLPFLTHAPLPIYGTFMDGTTVYGQKLDKAGIVILGNEANGVSPEIEACVNVRIGIPKFGNRSTESLNVASATAILLNEIRRR